MNYMWCDWHFANHCLQRFDFFARQHLGNFCGSRRCRDLGNSILFVVAGVTNKYLEHETVLLSFRQSVGTFLLDRVLCCQNEKRLRQCPPLAACGYLLLLHRLQHGRLRLGRRPVDFVRQNNIGKDRTLQETKFASTGGFVFLQDFGTRDVRGHQVRGELNPVEFQIQ